ncbi:MAG: hypothetical protein COB09_15465 [Thalassobium sp.]|nr:MAG: hypothetical protein COB09_15465 [Thalassobium sp.]
MAFLAIGIGSAIIAWVLYNFFVEVQLQYIGPNFITSLGSFGISIPMVGIGFYWLKRGCKHLTRRSRKDGLTPAA